MKAMTRINDEISRSSLTFTQWIFSFTPMSVQYEIPQDMFKPATLDRWPTGIAYRNGFRILGTPLGFGHVVGSLRFLDNLEARTPRKGERLITSHLLSLALGEKRRRNDILGLSYSQTIRLGQMALRIYPAGLGPGASQLEVSIKKRKILYCGGIRMAKPLICAASEVPRCDLLLLDVPVSEPKPPAPTTVSKALQSWLAQCIDEKQRPFLIFGNRAAAFDGVYSAGEAGVSLRVQRRLFEMVRRVSAELPIGNTVSRLGQKVKIGEGALISIADWHKSRFFSESDKRVAYIGPGRALPQFADVAFRMGESEDRPGILAYIKKTGAAQVALGDMTDETLTESLQEMGIEAFRLTHPTQIPLPFRI